MLKNKKIILIEIENASRLHGYFTALQAEVQLYEACPQSTALSLSLTTPPDYVIIEVAHQESMEIARLFAKNAPLTRIIVLSAPWQVQEVIAQNIQVHALLSLNYTFDDFLTCFWQLSEGYFYFSKELETQLNRRQIPLPTYPDFFKILSQREREVVSLLSEGFTNRQIGESLFISPDTVKNHKKNIIQKLNLVTNNDLLLFIGKLPEEWQEKLKK